MSWDGGTVAFVGGEWNGLMIHRRGLISRLSNSKNLKTKNWLTNFLSRFDRANLRNFSSHKSSKNELTAFLQGRLFDGKGIEKRMGVREFYRH
jgi:hypothetical protein